MVKTRGRRASGKRRASAKGRLFEETGGGGAQPCRGKERVSGGGASMENGASGGGAGGKGDEENLEVMPGIQPRTSNSHSRTKSALRSCVATAGPEACVSFWIRGRVSGFYPRLAVCDES